MVYFIYQSHGDTNMLEMFTRLMTEFARIIFTSETGS